MYYVKNYVSGLSLVNTEIRDFQNLKSEALQGQSWAFNEVLGSIKTQTHLYE